MTFLVPEDDLACEDLLIGQPALRNLKIILRKLLGNNLYQLDENNCYNEEYCSVDKYLGSIGRLMI